MARGNKGRKAASDAKADEQDTKGKSLNTEEPKEIDSPEAPEPTTTETEADTKQASEDPTNLEKEQDESSVPCLLYTSDAADE